MIIRVYLVPRSIYFNPFIDLFWVSNKIKRLLVWENDLYPPPEIYPLWSQIATFGMMRSPISTSAHPS